MKILKLYENLIPFHELEDQSFCLIQGDLDYITKTILELYKRDDGLFDILYDFKEIVPKESKYHNMTAIFLIKKRWQGYRYFILTDETKQEKEIFDYYEKELKLKYLGEIKLIIRGDSDLKTYLDTFTVDVNKYNL